MYIGMFLISFFFRLLCRIKFYLCRTLFSQAGDDVLQFLEEKLITPSCSLIVGLHKINDALQFLAENKSSGKVSGRIGKFFLSFSGYLKFVLGQTYKCDKKLTCNIRRS